MLKIQTERRLTPSQRAMCAEKALAFYQEQAKERQRLSQGRGVKGVEDLPHLKDDTGKARDKAGRAFGVSGKLVDG